MRAHSAKKMVISMAPHTAHLGTLTLEDIYSYPIFMIIGQKKITGLHVEFSKLICLDGIAEECAILCGFRTVQSISTIPY